MASEDEMKRRGRPRLPKTEVRRRNLTFRVRDALRDQLHDKALASGHSISEEIERRVERSFLPEQTFDEVLALRYGAHGAFLLRLIGAAILAHAGRGPLADLDTQWLNDKEAATEVVGDIDFLLKWLSGGTDRGALASRQRAGALIAAMAGLHPGKSWGQWAERQRALAGIELTTEIEKAVHKDVWRPPADTDNRSEG
jgi:hypothetical protein